MRGLWVLVVALGSPSLPATAWADVTAPQPAAAVSCPARPSKGAPSKSDPEATREAREKFTRGVRAYEAGEYEAAARAFQTAWCLVHATPVLYNLGQAYARSGKPREAARVLRAYLAESPKSPNRADVERQIAKLEPE